jgi:DME family drug/metabolite transporter
MNSVPIVAITFAFAAAFLFALSAHVQHIGLTDRNTKAATIIIVATTAGAHWLAAPFTVSPAYWLTAATLLFMLTGCIRPALSITLWVEGIKRLGPTLNAGISAGGPVFAATFAVLLLGEPLTTQIAIGTAGVVGGILVSAMRPKGIVHDWPLWALLLPLGAAGLRALAHAITKIGFAEVPDPVFAGLVASSVALVLLAGRFIASGEKWECQPREAFWFLMSGLTSAAGVYSLNVALQNGQVLIVSPIVASSPVFALLLAIVVFRREKLNWRTVGTIALVVSGVILVILGSKSG